MTENFQHKFYQEECKQSKGAKICASIRRELACEKKKCSKAFFKIFARQDIQNKTNEKHSSYSEASLKSTKKVSEKIRTEVDSSTCKVLSKIPNRKNLQSNNTTFAWLKFL